MEAPKKQTLLTPLMRWFLFAMILANIASGMVNMLMPIYLTELGASVGQVGLVFTLTSIVILVLQVLGGWISDSIGRLKAIAIGSVGGVLSFIAMLFAPSWQWMIVALSINQIPYALVGPSFGAFIAENSTEANRGRVYGLTDTIYQVTGILGPPLGGLLAGRFGFKVMILGATLFYASAAVLRIWMATTIKTRPDDAPALSFSAFKLSLRTVLGMALGGGVITWIFITDGVRDIGYRLTNELQPLYLEQYGGLSVEQIGFLGSLFSIAMMTTPILAGRFADRFGERVPITGGFLVIFVAMLNFLQASSFFGFALTWILFGLGVGVLSPAYQSLISKVVPRQSLGTFNGIFYSSMGLISLPAPWLGAQLWERYSPRLPFAITAALSLITILPVWLFFKIPQKSPEEPAQIPETGESAEPAISSD